MPFKLSSKPRVSPLSVIPQGDARCSQQPPPVSECGSSCRVRLLSESQSSGPVAALATFNDLLYSCTCSIATSAGLQAWTADTGLMRSVDLPLMPPTSAVTVNGSCLATADEDLKIRLWHPFLSGSTHQLQQQASLPSFRQLFYNWTLQHRYVQTCRNGKKYPWMQHSDIISALAFSPDGKCLYSASWDRTVKVWSLEAGHGVGRCEESFTAHIDSINSMVVGAKDGLLYTGSADKSIKVWCRRKTSSTAAGRRKISGNCNHSMIVALNEQRAAVNALVMSSDGSFLYSGGSDGRVLVWKRWSPWERKAQAAGQLFALHESLQGHERAVLCLDFVVLNAATAVSPFVISGSADNTIRLWRQREEINGSCCGQAMHDCVAVVKAHVAAVRSLRVGAASEEPSMACGCGGRLIFSADLDGSIKSWLLSLSSSTTTISSSSSSTSSTPANSQKQQKNQEPQKKIATIQDH